MKLNEEEIDRILQRAQYEKTKLNTYGKVFYYIKAYPFKHSQNHQQQSFEYKEHQVDHVVEEESENKDDSTIIENVLYRLISMICPSHSGKITGMLLELGHQEVQDLMNSTSLLKQKVQEALIVLKESGVEINQEDIDPVCYLELKLKETKEKLNETEIKLIELKGKMLEYKNYEGELASLKKEKLDSEQLLSNKISQLSGNLETATKIMTKAFNDHQTKIKECDQILVENKQLSLAIKSLSVKDIYSDVISRLLDMGILTTCKPQLSELNWLKRLVKMKKMSAKSINKIFKEGDNIPTQFPKYLWKFLERIQDEVTPWDEEDMFSLDE